MTGSAVQLLMTHLLYETFHGVSGAGGETGLTYNILDHGVMAPDEER